MDLKGFTALGLACQQGDIRIIELLMSKGASLEAIDIHGKKAVDYIQEDSVLFEHYQQAVEEKDYSSIMPPNRKRGLLRMNLSFSSPLLDTNKHKHRRNSISSDHFRPSSF
jgi:hypothetical protein